MSDPKRWLADPGAPEGARELLHAGDPLPVLAPEVQARLAEFAQGLAGDGAAAATGVTLSGKLVVGAALGLVVAAGVGGFVLTSLPPVEPGGPAAPPASALIAASDAPAAAAPRSEVATAAGEGSPSVREDRRRADEPGAGRGGAPSGRAVTDSVANLAAEAALLERARAALGAAPAHALRLTDEHRRTFPRGQLAAERELVAIDALVRLGRRAEAHARSAPLVATPNGPYARRVRRLLGDEK